MNYLQYLDIALKIIVGLSVLNVWLLRSSKSTPWRGGGTNSLKAEFEAYGLSSNAMRAVGAIKIILSILILVSIYYQPLEKFGATGMAIMMIGAIGMHIKIKDELKKSLPAFIFLVLSLAMLVIN